MLLAIGCWPLAFGYWLLAVGYWPLAFGCWLLAVGTRNSLHQGKKIWIPLLLFRIFMLNY
jgi:hypothetical protein